MARKFLNIDGLEHFLAKIKTWANNTFATPSDISSLSGTDIQSSATSKGVKVTLDGTVGSPAVTVETTTNGVNADNSGIVSGAEVKTYVDENAATKDVATSSSDGLMSSAMFSKLSGVASGAEVNQNAFSYVTVDDTTLSADSAKDTLTLESGNNVTLTPSANNDKITISATDTTYSLATAGQNGLMSSAQVSKLAGIESNANNYSLPSAGTNLGGVKTGGDVTISSGVITVNDDSHAHVISNVDGLQTELNGKQATIPDLETIRSGAALGATSLQEITKEDVTDALGYTPPTTNTTYSVVTSSVSGLAPKIGTATSSTVSSQANEWFLVSTKGGTPTWRKLPANAFLNTTYSVATSSTNGLMSSSDKSSLDTINGWYTGAVGTDTDTAINKWNEIVDFLDGIPEGDTLDGLITAVETSVSELKEDIEDGTITASNATIASKLGASTIGSDTKPIYLSSGVATACSYTLGTSVPSNAVFTDTKVTQTLSTANTSHPLLLAPSGQSGNATTSAYFDSGVTLNPSTNTISANISGNAATATKATQDSSGNTITATYAKISSLSDVATSGDYADLTNKPTIPTVNNATLTIQKNASTVGSFTANQSSNKTINITVPTNVSELTNDAGYKTVDTTYDVATSSKNGLMSSSMVSKLAEITASADSVSFTQNLTSGTKVGTITINGASTVLYAPTNTNTTYTFAGGTNKFTVTPSGGTAQSVSVTPSISNNVTYSGTLTSGQVAVYDGTAGKIKASGYTIEKSVPSNAVFTDTTYSTFVKSGSSAKSGLVPKPSTTAGTTKYLREDGSWVVPPNTTYSAATTTANGLMASSDKVNLNATIKSLSVSGKVITYTKVDGSTGTITTQDTNTTYSSMTSDEASSATGTTGRIVSAKVLHDKIQEELPEVMAGATASSSGVSGLVPAPASANRLKYLRGDGTWATPTNTTYSNATTSTAGLMSAADKLKLDGIANSANAYALPNATTTTLGGVKIGSNISVNSGTISLTKSNVTSALGYTPPTSDTNTTYSAGSGLSLSGTSFSLKTGYTTSGKNYAVKVDSNGNPYVNVPWTDTDTNTTYDVVTSSVAGLTPKIGTAAAATIGTQSTEWVLASTNGGTPTWRKLPSNAFLNTTYSIATSTSNGLMSSAQASIVVPNAWSGADAFGNSTSSNYTYIYGKSILFIFPNYTCYAIHEGNIGDYKSGDSTKWNGYNISVVSSLPSSKDSNTIYFVV